MFAENIFWKFRALGRRVPWIWKIGRLFGLNQLARRVHNRRILKRGAMTTNLLGYDLTFSIVDSQEILRAEDMSNEQVFIQQVLDAVQKNDVFYDVGANIGIFSLLIAAHGRDLGVRVHAFEPEPRNADQLRQNIELNNMSEVIQVHQLALGQEASTMNFHVHEGTGAGQHSLVEQGVSDQSIEVQVETGDSIAQELNDKPTVMKIDIEGAELLALKGMSQLLRTTSSEISSSKSTQAS